MKEYLLFIPDMSCMHCYKIISDLLKKEGIKEYELSLEKKQLKVTASDIDTLRKLLREAGYETQVEL